MMAASDDSDRNLPEDELQSRYHDHDSAALSELWRRYEEVGREFTRLAAHWARPDPDIAEEAVQQLGLRLSLDNVQAQYHPDRLWVAWASTILHNIVRDLQRQRQRHRAREQHPDDLDTLPDPLPPAESYEFQESVRNCLDRLSEERRQVLLLSMDGWTLQEIAEELDIPYGTAGSRLSRAREQMRECLEQEENGGLE
jgi:RNA polymerase sigma-70 factor, ECF subfamily